MIRLIAVYLMLTVCAIAFHENTYAVFELREQLLTLTLNLWELFEQLEYASDPLRQRVYLDIALVQAEIESIVRELMRLDSMEHPRSE